MKLGKPQLLCGQALDFLPRVAGRTYVIRSKGTSLNDLLAGVWSGLTCHGREKSGPWLGLVRKKKREEKKKRERKVRWDRTSVLAGRIH